MVLWRFQEVVLRREVKFTFKPDPRAGFVLRNQNVCTISR